RCCVPLVYAVSVNRVEHREYRTQCRVAHWTLILSFFVADNSTAIHFRSCSCQGQDRTQWQRILHSGLSNHKVPYITVIGNTCINSLGSIDNATATHCKDEVHLVLTAKGYSLANRRHAGIGLNTSELYIKDIVLLKQSGKLVVQPYTFNRTSSIGNQNPLTIPFNLRNDLLQLILTKINCGRDAIRKISHCESVFIIYI